MANHTILGNKCEICGDQTSWGICPYCQDAIDEATTSNDYKNASALAGDPLKFRTWWNEHFSAG